MTQMAETKNPIRSLKDKVALRTRVKRVFSRKGSDLIVISGPLSLLFFTLAFLVFLPLLQRDSDWLRLLIVVYGSFVILWGLVVVYDYLIKASRLLANKRIHNYSQLSALNTVLGLALPLFVINSVASVVVRTLSNFTNFGTAVCEIRLSLVRFYYASDIYDQLSSLTFWVTVLAIGLLVLGGVFERMMRK